MQKKFDYLGNILQSFAMNHTPKTLTVKRETKDIFIVQSDFPYWADGRRINARVAFDEKSHLSSIRAQAIDQAADFRYLLIAPISFKHPAILAAAGGLQVGESESVVVS